MKNILPFDGKAPKIDKNAWISKQAYIVGDVSIGEHVSVHEHVSIKGDLNSIIIGEDTNVQSGAIVHSQNSKSCTIGRGCTIGHGAIVHACTLDDYVTVGIGATIMGDAHIGRYAMIGARALITDDMEIPERSVAMGIPAKVTRELSDDEIKRIEELVLMYHENGQKHKRLRL
jgi:carbonic anhydrase/acetyltransferase-like protein (isoleucine patch superfamily)